MKIKTILACLFYIFPAISFGNGFDDNYEVRIGSYNGGSADDLYIRQKPQIILLHGDIVTPIVLPAPINDFILSNNGDGTFTLIDTLSGSESNQGSSWPTASININLGDFNVDGYLDIFLEGVSLEVSGANDQFIFSEAVESSSPQSVTAATPDFINFFTEVTGWLLDEDYFENTAIENDWYHYEGDEITAWWYITYINQYWGYTYNGQNLSFLDGDDDPYDPNSPPTFCTYYPSNCGFDSFYGIWIVYGTYIDNIEVVLEYENFNQDAIDFKTYSDDALHDPINGTFNNENLAEQVLESVLLAQIGTTTSDVLSNPIPWPELPPEIDPLPGPRTIELPLPEPANDPSWFPGIRKIIKIRAITWICGLLCPETIGDSESKTLIWEQIGYEEALEQILEEFSENETPRALIGESDPTNINRIPNAASYYDAIIFAPNFVDLSGNPYNPTNQQLWIINWSWIKVLELKQAQFYDIGRVNRDPHGFYYPCERETLVGYPYRSEVNWGTEDWYYDSCNLW